MKMNFQFAVTVYPIFLLVHPVHHVHGDQQTCEMPSTFAGTISVLSRSGNPGKLSNHSSCGSGLPKAEGKSLLCAGLDPAQPPHRAWQEPWMMGRVRKGCSSITDLLSAWVKGNTHKGENTLLLKQMERYKPQEKMDGERAGIRDHGLVGAITLPRAGFAAYKRASLGISSSRNLLESCCVC